MLKSNFIILIITFIILQVSYVVAEEKFLSLKKNKVNVRYGPSFDSPVKYIYKKINLPIMQIDEKENFRRIIDYKKNILQEEQHEFGTRGLVQSDDLRCKLISCLVRRM